MFMTGTRLRSRHQHYSRCAILQQGMHMKVFCKVYCDRVHFLCAERFVTGSGFEPPAGPPPTHLRGECPPPPPPPGVFSKVFGTGCIFCRIESPSRTNSGYAYESFSKVYWDRVYFLRTEWFVTGSGFRPQRHPPPPRTHTHAYAIRTHLCKSERCQ